MVFPVVGGTQDTGYEISNSLRFNDDDNPNLTFTPSSAVTSERKTFTISWWVKRANLGTTGFMWEMGGNDNANERIIARFDSNNRLNVNDSSTAFRIPNRAFRDLSAWYHIVVAFDTTDSTADNRVKVYINGVQETSFLTSNNPGQNDTKGFSHNSEHTIGRTNIDNGSPFDGYMTEFHAVGGSQLDATSFGEFDDNGVWIPKRYTGSHGTNGFYLEFKQTGTSQNSSGIGADTSGNDNHFAVSNLAATDVTTDTCTNNFNTLNPLVPHHSIFNAETEGNTGLSSSGVQLQGGYMGSTIMPTSGKWYFEVNILSISGSSDRTGIAIPRFESVTGTTHIEGGDYAGFTVSTGSIGRVFVTEGSSTTETDNSEYVFNEASVAIFAVDMDASTPRVYVGKNGTWFTTSAGSGGNPATNTGYFEANLSTGGSGFSVGARHSAGSSAAQSYLYNFGQPAYTISSGNSDANGYGNFEYAVPSGYYSICTKNLAEFG